LGLDLADRSTLTPKGRVRSSSSRSAAIRGAAGAFASLLAHVELACDVAISTRARRAAGGMASVLQIHPLKSESK
jgi:hypothetical protein